MHDFQDIVGNSSIIKTLKNSVINGRVNHAYIFEGEEGIGKMLMAQTFAKALLCEQEPKDGSACGMCSSCLSFHSYNNPDVIYVKPTKTKALGVDDIREQVNKEIITKPYKYKYKIFIIENAETMTPSAQNALLKTLEEPSHYGVFLLTTQNVNLLLPTVLSRCFTMKLKPLPFNDVKNYLVNISGLSDERAHFISVYAGGSIGQAVKVADDEKFTEMRGRIIDILDGIYEKDLADVFALAKEFEGMKDSINDALNIAFLWYRDIAVLKEFNDSSLILQKDIKDKLLENTRMNTESVYRNIDALWDAKMNLKYNANFQLTTEVLLMKLQSQEKEN